MMMFEFRLNGRRWWLAAFALCLAVLAVSRSKPAPVGCTASPLTDSVGEASEKARIEFQWMVIKVGLDSALRSGAGIEAHRNAGIALDSSIARYRDSIRVDGNRLVSRTGCVDWRATWLEGRFDRTALATVMVDALVGGGPNLLEWSLTDSGFSAIRLHVVFSQTGKDGGTIDSTVLSISATDVGIVR